MWILRFALLLIAVSQSCVSNSDAAAVTVECQYDNVEFVKENVPSCVVKNKARFVGDRVKVAGVSDVASKDFTGFSLTGATRLTKFPRNLEKFFTSLIGISIVFCKLSEVSHNDLKAFPNLKYLLLYYNEIEVLYADTFAANPNLEVIHLQLNKISHIDRSTFNHLSKLTVLILNENVCDFESYPKTLSGVATQVETIQNGKCTSSEYDTTTTTSENPLVAELRALNESNAALVSNNTNLKQELDEKSLEIVSLGSQVANLTAELEACAIKDRQRATVEEKLDKILDVNKQQRELNLKLFATVEKLLNQSDQRDHLDEAGEQLRIRLIEVVAVGALKKELSDVQTPVDESNAKNKSGE